MLALECSIWNFTRHGHVTVWMNSLCGLIAMTNQSPCLPEMQVGEEKQVELKHHPGNALHFSFKFFIVSHVVLI